MRPSVLSGLHLRYFGRFQGVKPFSVKFAIFAGGGVRVCDVLRNVRDGAGV